VGDRTFSADDVIRIYREFLTETEMKTVEDFFAEDPVEQIDLSFVENLLSRLQAIATILGSNTIGVLVALFSPVATVVLREANVGLRDTNRILSNIVTSGGVDA
jgi:hypothetical protein